MFVSRLLKKAYGYQEEPTHDDSNRNNIVDEPNRGIEPEDNPMNHNNN